MVGPYSFERALDDLDDCESMDDLPGIVEALRESLKPLLEAANQQTDGYPQLYATPEWEKDGARFSVGKRTGGGWLMSGKSGEWEVWRPADFQGASPVLLLSDFQRVTS